MSTTTQIFIRQGKAILTSNGLRCQGPREKDPSQVCNKLLVKKSPTGQISGSFRCERCHQDITVEIAIK